MAGRQIVRVRMQTRSDVTKGHLLLWGRERFALHRQT